MTPAKHSLDKDLVRMVKQGWMERKSPAFLPAFQTLEITSASSHSNIKAWPRDLLVTKDFVRTIQTTKVEKQDDFLRPVQWILSCARNEVFVIISPYEANELLPSIRQQRYITLHVYSPRVRDSMSPLDDLGFCTTRNRADLVPILDLNTRIQLNLFAGQLYFRNHEEYISACRLLGLCFRPLVDQINVSADGFVDPGDREKLDEEMARVCSMDKSPIDMLRALMEFRRKGQGLGKSHIGLLLGGELIQERAFLN